MHLPPTELIISAAISPDIMEFNLMLAKSFLRPGLTWSPWCTGFPEVLPCGAAEPVAEGADCAGGANAGLRQGVAGRPAVPQGA